ncbi:hypothetical protein L5M11_13105 [Shewanella sp. SM87]|uniref:hypothetical protein n=1 Tax=Shewanella sp. SM87 TaxID=2912808 RepID=UPI0021DACAAA|nr:hypothetical protein [Shewanella sp. SM87]MCU8008453.1 hypothetical protein [Shewanella sp. SM87]
MKQRPIIFNTEMVQAILDGRKTQTRRIVKPLKDKNFGCNLSPNEIAGEVNNGDLQNCQFGEVGDQLYVRETFQVGLCTKSTIAYKATHKPSDLEDGWYEVIKWKPSIHMPRWAARIILEITDVRVERLKDISEEDAIAEGCDYPEIPEMGWKFKAAFNFKFLWKKIYGEQSLKSNPWVWVIEFKVISTTGGEA